MKMDTVWQAKVADSAIRKRTRTFGCGGCPFQLGFGYFGAQFGLGLAGMGQVQSKPKLVGLGPWSTGQSPIDFIFFSFLLSFSRVLPVRPLRLFCFFLVLLHGRGGERAARRRSWEIDGSGGVDRRWVYAGRELTGAEMVIGEATAACWARCGWANSGDWSGHG